MMMAVKKRKRKNEQQQKTKNKTANNSQIFLIVEEEIDKLQNNPAQLLKSPCLVTWTNLPGQKKNHTLVKCSLFFVHSADPLKSFGFCYVVARKCSKLWAVTLTPVTAFSQREVLHHHRKSWPVCKICPSCQLKKYHRTFHSSFISGLNKGPFLIILWIIAVPLIEKCMHHSHHFTNLICTSGSVSFSKLHRGVWSCLPLPQQVAFWRRPLNHHPSPSCVHAFYVLIALRLQRWTSACNCQNYVPKYYGAWEQWKHKGLV